MPALSPVLRPEPPALAADDALFLDVDGTLLEFADAPDAVRVSEALRVQLQQLHRQLDGALALVSGRSLATLDRLFAPLRLPGAGLHGLERRNGDRDIPAPAPPAALDGIHRQALELTARLPGTLVEHKAIGLGLHWRRAPEHGPALLAFAEAVLPQLPGYRIQHGDHVAELRPAGADKGDAIADLLTQPPFSGRRPVFAGDDLTDEHGFHVVNAVGGVSVLVGDREPTAAGYRLADVPAVHRWLRSLDLPAHLIATGNTTA